MLANIVVLAFIFNLASACMQVTVKPNPNSQSNIENNLEGEKCGKVSMTPGQRITVQSPNYGIKDYPTLYR